MQAKIYKKFKQHNKIYFYVFIKLNWLIKGIFIMNIR